MNPTTIDSFADNTSLHGLKNIVLSKTKGKFAIATTIFWSVLFISFVCGCIFMLTITTMHYFQYPSSTTVTVETSSELEFPSVTLCTIMSLKPDIEMEIKEEYARGLINRSSQLRTNESYKEWIEEELKKITIAEYYDFRGYKIEDIFVDCKFREEIHNCSEIFKPFYTDFGKCFTFQSNEYIKTHGRFVSYTPGPSQGLILVLNSQKQTITEVKSFVGAGLRVLIHDPKVYPLMEQRNFLASTGFQTFAAMRLNKYTKLSYPYSKSKCILPKEKTYGKHEYSKELCEYLCFDQMKYNGSCSRLDDGTELACTLYDRFSSGSNKLKPNVMNECTSKCLPTCENTVYDYTITAAEYSETSLLRVSRKENWPMRNVSFIQNNYVHLSIYFQSFDYIQNIQKADVTYYKVLSDFGGILGIFLGASFITVFELLEYCCLKVFFSCMKKQNSVTQMEVTK